MKSVSTETEPRTGIGWTNIELTEDNGLDGIKYSGR